ncbi:MAG: tetratricopeptide repeat protein [Desulfobacteraceae bacterium]|nr:tetratricopeptide repeat protein [Desulfobacteraceae bacterium]
MGYPKEAEPLLKQAQKQSTEALGNAHSTTLGISHNYAHCLYDLVGNLRDSKPILKQVWKLSSETLGESHIDTLVSLRNYADCLNGQEALALYKQAWKQSIDNIGAKHPDTLLSTALYADSLGSSGMTQEAQLLLKSVCKDSIELLGEKHPHTILFLDRHATSLTDLGRTQEAEQLHKKVWKLSIEVFGKKHITTLTSKHNYSYCLFTSNRFQKAAVLSKQAWQQESKTIGEMHDNTLSSLNIYATCLIKLKRFHKAAPLFKQSWEQRAATLGKDDVETLNSLDSYAMCLLNLGRTEEAEPLSKHAYIQLTKVLGRNHPHTLTSLNNYAACLDSSGKKEDAAKYSMQLAMQLSEIPFVSIDWLESVEIISEALAMHGVAGRCPQWAQAFQALSHTYIEVLDLQPPEQLKIARTYFLTYHARYLGLCIEQGTSELIPKIIAIIQGRKLGALYIETMKAKPISDDDELTGLKTQILALRTELRHLSIGLQSLAIDAFKKNKTNTPPHAKQTNVQKNRFDIYEQRYDQYRDLIRQLKEKDADFAITAPMLNISTERLQTGLQKRHAIALVIDKIADIPAFILFISKSKCQLIRLQSKKLTKLYETINGYNAEQTMREGMRRTYNPLQKTSHPSQRGESDVPKTFEDLKATVSECFWQTWESALDNIRTLHIITQGDSHILPYDLGCPAHVNLHTYPGLLFYYQLHHTSSPSRSIEKRIGIQAYSATDSFIHNPIPLVDTEPLLLKALWGQKSLHTPVDFTQSIHLYALHLAGHGFHSEDDPLSSSLVMGDNEKLDIQTVLRSPLKPQVVFQSACVVGRITEDSDGDPLGLVSAFFMREAQYVIASVQPVNDFYMPLLVCLFYQSWLAGSTAHDALREAKRRLRTGDWYPDTERLIRKTYQPVLTSHLKKFWKSKTAMKRVVNTWIPPYTLDKTPKDHETSHTAELKRMQERLHESIGNHAPFVKDVLNLLCKCKSSLPITDLYVWVRGFG